MSAETESAAGTLEEVGKLIYKSLAAAGARGLCTQELARATGVPRRALNRALYGMAEEGWVSREATVPPVWTLRDEGAASSGESKKARVSEVPLVIVDLGNMHCLDKLVPLAAADLVEVWAYADQAFAGYGVRPSVAGARNVTLKQADSPHRNAADVQLIWDVARLAQKRSILVASKDLGFRHLEQLARDAGHELEFFTTWEDLRDCIE